MQTETGTESPGTGGKTSRLRDMAVIIVAAAAAALFLRVFVVEAYHIPSRSMEPALLAGDRLLVSRLFYGTRIGSFVLPGWSSPKRGSIIVFEIPSTGGGRGGMAPFIKRCVGIPGDTVVSVGGNVWVNGSLVSGGAGEDPGLTPPPGAGWRIPLPGDEIRLSLETLPLWHSLIAREGHKVEVLPAGDFRIDGEPVTTYKVAGRHYFVLGDNRADSYDSRQWGLLPEDSIIGTAAIIYWSRSEGKGDSGEIRWSRIGNLPR